MVQKKKKKKAAAQEPATSPQPPEREEINSLPPEEKQEPAQRSAYSKTKRGVLRQAVNMGRDALVSGSISSNEKFAKLSESAVGTVDFILAGAGLDTSNLDALGKAALIVMKRLDTLSKIDADMQPEIQMALEMCCDIIGKYRPKTDRHSGIDPDIQKIIDYVQASDDGQ